MSEESFLRKLKGNHIAVLLALLKYETLLLRDVQELLRTRYDYANSIMEDLKQWGLVEEFSVGMKRRFRVFRLTEKGRKLAHALREFA